MIRNKLGKEVKITLNKSNFIDISAKELSKGNSNSKIDEIIKEIISDSKNTNDW